MKNKKKLEVWVVAVGERFQIKDPIRQMWFQGVDDDGKACFGDTTEMSYETRTLAEWVAKKMGWGVV